jgi:hypothetical protein
MGLPIALARLHVTPYKAAVPDRFARLDVPLRQGMPQAIPLAGNQRLLLIAPSGVALPWRELDPAQVAASSMSQVEADAGLPLRLDIAPRLPLRVLYQVGGRTLGAVPLVCGARQMLGTDGAVAIEVVLLEWLLHVGTLRGAGDFGSRLVLAWRHADRALERFSDPPLNPVFVQRQPPERRLESHVGRTKMVMNTRFVYKKFYGVKIK